MKKQTDAFKRLRAVMKDVNGDHRQIIKTMQDQIDYLMEFIDIQGEILEEKTGHRQPELSEDQKKRLAGTLPTNLQLSGYACQGNLS